MTNDKVKKKLSISVLKTVSPQLRFHSPMPLLV